jgi:HlyD family secretion protein
MPLILSIGAIEDEKFDATLEYVAPKGKEENGAIQFEIKANVKLKSNNFIRAGYSANADIVLDRRDSVMVIPESLIQFEKSGDSAYVEVEKQPQVFDKRYIKTGLSDGVNIEIKEGITKDDKIKGAKIETTPAPKKEGAQG